MVEIGRDNSIGFSYSKKTDFLVIIGS